MMMYKSTTLKQITKVFKSYQKRVKSQKWIELNIGAEDIEEELQLIEYLASRWSWHSSGSYSYTCRPGKDLKERKLCLEIARALHQRNPDKSVLEYLMPTVTKFYCDGKSDMDFFSNELCLERFILSDDETALIPQNLVTKLSLTDESLENLKFVAVDRDSNRHEVKLTPSEVKRLVAHNPDNSKLYELHKEIRNFKNGKTSNNKSLAERTSYGQTLRAIADGLWAAGHSYERQRPYIINGARFYRSLSNNERDFLCSLRLHGDFSSVRSVFSQMDKICRGKIDKGYFCKEVLKSIYALLEKRPDLYDYETYITFLKKNYRQLRKKVSDGIDGSDTPSFSLNDVSQLNCRFDGVMQNYFKLAVERNRPTIVNYFFEHHLDNLAEKVFTDAANAAIKFHRFDLIVTLFERKSTINIRVLSNIINSLLKMAKEHIVEQLIPFAPNNNKNYQAHSYYVYLLIKHKLQTDGILPYLFRAGRLDLKQKINKKTLFDYAVEYDHEVALLQMVNCNNNKNPDYSSYALKALKKDNLATLTILLDTGYVNEELVLNDWLQSTNSADSSHFVDLTSCLHVAIRTNKKALIQLLLKSGRVNLLDTIDGKNAFDLALENQNWYMVIQSIESIVQFLPITENLEKALIIILLKASEENLCGLAVECLSFVNPNQGYLTGQYAGYTPMHFAIKYKNYDFLKELLEHGANPQIKFADGSTPQAYAVANEDMEAVQCMTLYVKKDQTISDNYCTFFYGSSSPISSSSSLRCSNHN